MNAVTLGTHFFEHRSQFPFVTDKYDGRVGLSNEGQGVKYHSLEMHYVKR